MSMQHVFQDGKLVCTFQGSMNSAACSTLLEALDVLLQEFDSRAGATAIEFDMAEVPYMASPFLRLCKKASLKCGNANFRMTHVQQSVKDVLKIAGIENLWAVE